MFVGWLFLTVIVHRHPGLKAASGCSQWLRCRHLQSTYASTAYADKGQFSHSRNIIYPAVLQRTHFPQKLHRCFNLSINSALLFDLLNYWLAQMAERPLWNDTGSDINLLLYYKAFFAKILNNFFSQSSSTAGRMAMLSFIKLCPLCILLQNLSAMLNQNTCYTFIISSISWLLHCKPKKCMLQPVRHRELTWTLLEFGCFLHYFSRCNFILLTRGPQHHTMISPKVSHNLRKFVAFT